MIFEVRTEDRLGIKLVLNFACAGVKNLLP